MKRKWRGIRLKEMNGWLGLGLGETKIKGGDWCRSSGKKRGGSDRENTLEKGPWGKGFERGMETISTPQQGDGRKVRGTGKNRLRRVYERKKFTYNKEEWVKSWGELREKPPGVSFFTGDVRSRGRCKADLETGRKTRMQGNLKVNGSQSKTFGGRRKTKAIRGEWWDGLGKHTKRERSSSGGSKVVNGDEKKFEGGERKLS